MTQTLQELNLNVVKYLIGCESGVPFYDKICHELNLDYGNEYDKSELRRNKFLMQEQIKKDGLRSIKQKLIESKEEAISWSRNNLT
eukprot:CAMPEP_0116898368 /NCGR_PEP_ID=MMETSP0467-20121206/7095_1 /TAXON_ID=283647 /ORGANISM="Mesodinium pulex, Strain SPMC105" /LENGTH=85 /DNA_ID=CAMNT_0004570435 /DNA_START=190 /DNA_END=447 /DNA_ORIENTATION=+